MEPRMRLIIILILSLPILTNAALDIKYFDKASNGKQKIDFTIEYSNTSINKSATANSSSKTEITNSETLFALNYGYGLADDMALHFNIGYFLGDEESVFPLSASSNENYKITGLSDALISLIGVHDSGVGAFNWQLELGYSFGSAKTKETVAGPPAEFEKKAASGRTTLSAQLGYAHDIGFGVVGAAAKVDVVKSNADFKYTDLVGAESALEVDGGKEMSSQLFYELLGDQILWGVALGYFKNDSSEVKLAGAVLSENIDESFYRFDVYSRLGTGPGQELLARFGYDFYSESGGGNFIQKIDDGTSFSVSMGYAVEF